MLVIPAVTARLLTSRFSRMLLLSSTLGATAGLVGMYASYFADVPSGTMIVLVCAAGFGLALAFGARLRNAGSPPTAWAVPTPSDGAQTVGS